MEALRIENKKDYYAPIDIIRFILNGSLFEGDPSHWTNQQLQQQKQREKERQTGVVHATYSKDHLIEGRSVAISSFWTLERQIQCFSHWTPQVYMWGKQNNAGRNFNNLRFITCLGVEIDQKIRPEEIHYTAAIVGLPSPNLILSTPRGMQWFYVLESPFAGSHKARRAGKFVAEELKRAFVELVGADPGTNPLGYFRLPNEDNIEFFQGDPINTEWLLAWAKKKGKEHQRAAAVKKENSSIIGKPGNIICDPAIQEIIHNVLIKGSKGRIGRNNAIFTLSLALKYEGKSQDEIYDQMDEWNSKLKKPLNDREVRGIVRSALKDNYKAPSKEYVEALSGKKAQFHLHIRTPKKPREERIRSHYEERERDIIDYLKLQSSMEHPYLVGSIRALAERFGMAKETLMDVLKISKKLIKRTYGKGRAARTYITCRSVLLKSNAHKMKEFLLEKSHVILDKEHEPSLPTAPIIDILSRKGRELKHGSGG